MYNKLTELSTYGLGVGKGEDQSMILLPNKGRTRCIVVPVGELEAETVLMYLRETECPRPLPHHLIGSIARSFDIEINRVIIDDCRNGVFSAKIEMERGDTPIYIDARVTDALSIALLGRCPVYMVSDLFDHISIPLLKSTDSFPPEKEAKFEKAHSENLEHALQRAIEAEDYEQAATIQREITRRNNPNNE